ncbi:MAG TPA: hypothetical protein VGC18_02050 [Lacisediminihabitans sp.]|uniref:LolA family protein n=1 Tax=Lacisediminihabitans sp. TaxID=2787631 RepID=UPI002ED83288
MTRRWVKWMPAVAVPAVIAIAVIAVPFQANAAADLPAKTPDQLLAMIANSSVRSLSGTITQTSDLGLPELPAGAMSTGSGPSGSPSGSTSSDSAAASGLDLLTGSHTARVYLDGATKARLQVLDSLAERDVIRNGSDVWLYSSSENAVTHVTLPAGSAGRHTPTPGEVRTPAQLAKELLAKVGPTTAVTVGRPTTVAGRTAYDLVVSPKGSGSLVKSVSIAVDSTTGLPLSLAVRAQGQKTAAFSVAYTELSIGKPDASRFSFVPPAGATVKQQKLPAVVPGTTAPGTPAQAAPAHTVVGSGWSSVVELPAGTVPAAATRSPLFSELTTAVTGGRVFSTSLVTVLLTSDGRVVAGSVPVARLQDVAAGR